MIIEKTNYIDGHVFINIYDNDDSKLNTIRNFIRHELVHAYEDLKRYEHGKELFSDMSFYWDNEEEIKEIERTIESMGYSI